MNLIGRWSIASFLTVLLNVAWYGLWVFLAGTMCILMTLPFTDLTDAETSIGAAFSVNANAVQITAPSIGVESAQLEDVRGTLRYPLRHRADIVAPGVGLILFLAFVQWVLGELRALLRTVRDGRPFARVNATRIRRIGWAVIAGELARALVTFLSDSYVVSHFTASGLRFEAELDVNVIAVITGLIILVISEVFRTGTRLDEDHALTI